MAQWSDPIAGANILMCKFNWNTTESDPLQATKSAKTRGTMAQQYGSHFLLITQ